MAGSLTQDDLWGTENQSEAHENHHSRRLQSDREPSAVSYRKQTRLEIRLRIA